MSRATRFAMVTAMVAAFIATPEAGAGTTIEPIRRCAGHLVLDARSGRSQWTAGGLRTNTTLDAYDNLESTALYGIFSSDPNAVWGDSLELAQHGLIQEIGFTIANSSLSTSPLYSVFVYVTFRDAASHVGLGTYTFEGQLGAGLAPGDYVRASVIGLEFALPYLTLNSNEIIVEQQISTNLGPGMSLGVVSCSPPTVGTSPPSMYLSASDLFPTAGFYRLDQGSADPGFRLRVDVVDAARRTSWGRVKGLYR